MTCKCATQLATIKVMVVPIVHTVASDGNTAVKFVVYRADTVDDKTELDG